MDQKNQTTEAAELSSASSSQNDPGLACVLRSHIYVTRLLLSLDCNSGAPQSKRLQRPNAEKWQGRLHRQYQGVLGTQL